MAEHCLKVIEEVCDKVIRDIVDIAKFQFGFVPGRGTTVAIFIVSKLQERCLTKEINPYFAFVEYEKAFDRVPSEALWWALTHVSISEWQWTYLNVKSKVWINSSLQGLWH